MYFGHSERNVKAVQRFSKPILLKNLFCFNVQGNGDTQGAFQVQSSSACFLEKIKAFEHVLPPPSVFNCFYIVCPILLDFCCFHVVKNGILEITITSMAPPSLRKIGYTIFEKKRKTFSFGVKSPLWILDHHSLRVLISGLLTR